MDNNSVDRRIAMGRGSQNTVYHFDFLDIDNTTYTIADRITKESPKELLVYQTQHGYHLVDPTHTKDRSILLNPFRNIVDPKCPHNAVRIYPTDDYKLIQVPILNHFEHNCPRVLGIYDAIFGVTLNTYPLRKCDHSLKFGIYTVEKEGKKLHGEERVNA